METINLVTDRTQADVDAAKAEIKRVQEGGMPSAAYLSGLKGCYTAADLTRVETAVRQIGDSFSAAGYTVSVSTKTNWVVTDIFGEDDLERYLGNVAALRALIGCLSETPETPDSVNLYTKANDIEQILADLGQLLQNIEYGWLHSGEPYCGEG